MEIIKNDTKKMYEDKNAIKDIIKELEEDAESLMGKNEDSLLRNVINEQDSIMDDLEKEYDRLMSICKELGHITNCIEKTRKKYNRCEEKISDLLDKIRISEMKI